jgi:hypothetical protein
MNCDYVRQYYNVPAEIGRRIRASGKIGTIVADRGHYIGVNLDSDKPSRILNYHPTDGVEYLDELKTPRKASRGSERYRRYLDVGECFQSFIHFCRYEDARERGML